MRDLVREEDLIAYAGQLGLAKDKFTLALESRTYRLAVEKDLEEARRREVRGTPVFFVNDKRIDGLQPLSMFQEIIETELRQVALSKR
jgi:predicted DsbA family dithiol-disulfide isomerase